MSISSLMGGLFRHTGYALVSLGFVLVGIEFFVPAFATPYVHLYRLIIVGLVLALLAGRTDQVPQRQRWVMGTVMVAILLLAVFTQLPVRGSTAGLALAASVAVIVFFLVSVYPKDL